jgi:hypothetical protein
MNTVECIQSRKASFRAAIHLKDKPTLHQEEIEQVQESERRQSSEREL